ncbi:MAG: metal ABC transporter ATP-binding protein [Peptococcaceae bacterium]|nr:metal ABC transporter ATP-binding protein [Peptococcaceae bacterium]
MSENPVLEIDQVTFSYGCHPVVEDISLKVAAGEFIAVTGPNGSGKSTLLKLILGLLKPSSGSIRLFGENPGRSSGRYRVGYVAQKPAVNTGFPSTVEEVVAAGRTAPRGLFKLLGADDRRQVHESLRLVGLYGERHKPIGALSGGQQQRAFIARALAARPQLLILDEPATGIDTAAREQLYGVLKDLVSREGMTIIMVSHDLEAVASLAQRQVCLNRRLCTCQLQRPEENILSLAACRKRPWTA